MEQGSGVFPPDFGSSLEKVGGELMPKPLASSPPRRVRGDRSPEEPDQPVVEAPPKKRRCSASWARLVSKVF